MSVDKIRIDAGKSRRGWSFYTPFIQCNYKHRLDKEFRGSQGLARPLAIGILGHDIQAHHHTIEGIKRYGSVVVNGVEYNDADAFMGPMEAVMDHAKHEVELAPYTSIVQQAYMNYMINPPPIDRQHTVETELVGVVGKKNGSFGFWLVREDAWDELNEEVSTLPADDGGTIKVTKLYVKGHKDCNKPVYLSRRLDLTTIDSADWITVIDHKHQQNIFSKPHQYNADSGFAAIWALSLQKWPGRVKSVDIHGISVNDRTPGKWRVKHLKYSKLHARNLPHLILRTARSMATLDVHEQEGYIDRAGWPMTGAIEVGGGCISIYKNQEGWTCPYFEHCHHGKDL